MFKEGNFGGPWPLTGVMGNSVSPIQCIPIQSSLVTVVSRYIIP